jgi:hypothetical protein
MEFWFVTVIPKYLNFAAFLKAYLPSFLHHFTNTEIYKREDHIEENFREIHHIDENSIQWQATVNMVITASFINTGTYWTR